MKEVTKILLDQVLQHETEDLLKLVHQELATDGEVSKITEQAIEWFFDDPYKFANFYRREQKRKARSLTYIDEKGDIRLTETGELPAKH